MFPKGDIPIIFSKNLYTSAALLLLIDMSKSTEEHIDAKIRRILKSETFISDLTFRFACESFSVFPAYIASVMTGDGISVRDVRVHLGFKRLVQKP